MVFTPSEEVTSLRGEVERLTQELIQAKSDYKALEWRYCCQLNLQMQLGDYAREQGIKIPERFLSSF